MSKYVIAYIGSGLAFVVLDALWLTFMGPKFYKPVLGDMMTGQVRILPAILFYLMYVGGIVFLAVKPSASLGQAALTGAVLGLVAYGTYDLTSQAILRNWSWTITLTDVAWGMVASAAGATAGFWAVSKLAR